MNSRLAQRHVLVTGAGGGIGLAIAQACAQAGARVTLVDRAAQASDGVKELQMLHAGALQYLAGDVTQAQDIDAFVAAAIDHSGPVHALVNNAAVFEMAPLLQADADSFDRLFAVNVKGMFFVMQ
ncbi:MAG: SDR family NAD(P)-dependent oxidoreductase, partial [Proteobacteria bacterium]|nr:SDR family NAD(P)-dependent oxidoreductase [Pseudomonadota bacterium]